jgi:hypothetical protein
MVPDDPLPLVVMGVRFAWVVVRRLMQRARIPAHVWSRLRPVTGRWRWSAVPSGPVRLARGGERSWKGR